ncbi:Fe2+-dependent dioxygenase [Phycisphaeraceae bacterium D3-23]
MIQCRNVLSAAQLAELKQALAGADFADGSKTAGPAIRHLKKNLQLDDPEANLRLGRQVLDALWRHEMLNAWAVPRRYATPLFSRYQPGMAYGAHVDAGLMGGANPMRTDISITVFLNEPSEYEGGELVIEIPGGQYQVKFAAGDAVAYPTFSLHRVNPVTSGERLVAVTWAQSVLRDPEARKLHFDLLSACSSLAKREPDAGELPVLQRVRHNLVRLLAEA